MNLPQLSKDKANHYVYGGVAAVVGSHVAQALGYDPRLCAIVAAAAAGVIKDVRDLITRKGTFDPLDIVATAAGAIPVVAAA